MLDLRLLSALSDNFKYINDENALDSRPATSEQALNAVRNILNLVYISISSHLIWMLWRNIVNLLKPKI